jgi:GT2 family glycosyltransferase
LKACSPVQAKNETSQRSFRVLAVDDAGPNPMLRTYLAHLAKEKRIDLLVNPVNLGFVGAVNRALGEGDVILLNADTVVPPGFVERLAEAAHSAADIGTVTPLSNNGDIFSFPKPGDLPTDVWITTERSLSDVDATTRLSPV